DPQDGGSDGLRDLLERELVVPVDLEPTVAPGGVDESEGLAIEGAKLDRELDGRRHALDALELVVETLTLAAGGGRNVKPELQSSDVQVRRDRPERVPDVGQAAAGLDGLHGLADNLPELEVSPPSGVGGGGALRIEIAQLPDQNDDHDADRAQQKRALDAVRR